MISEIFQFAPMQRMYRPKTDYLRPRELRTPHIHVEIAASQCAHLLPAADAANLIDPGLMP